MRHYLEFTTEGEILEHKTQSTEFISTEFMDYKFIESIIWNNTTFIILFNQNEKITKNKNKNQLKLNLTSLPFYQKNIYGNFLLFVIDSINNIKSLTENKFLKFLNKHKKDLQDIEDYSSDDFNLSE